MTKTKKKAPKKAVRATRRGPQRARPKATKAPVRAAGKLPVSRPTGASRAKKVGFDFTAGYLIQTEFAAEGGVTYERRQTASETDGRQLKTEFLTKKRVDDVELIKDSRSVVWRAYYVLAKHAAHTPIGYFADAGMLEALERDFDEVRSLAREFNELAASLGSARRVRVEIYPLDVGVDNETVARRLAKLVRERLAGLRDSLATADLKEFKEANDRAKNLEKLATGIQRDSIRYALEAARDARKELAKAIKADGSKTPEEHAATLVADKKLEAIEAAIDLFSEPEGALADARDDAESALA